MSSGKFVRINIPVISKAEPWSANSIPRRRVSIKTLKTFLPVLLLISLVINVFYLTRPPPLSLPDVLNSHRLKENANANSISNPLINKAIKHKPIDYTELTDLIIVPGHGLYTGKGSPIQEAFWDFTPAQKGQHDTYLRHIGVGIEAIKQHDSALLLFSGTSTRPLPNFISESSGYWMAASKLNWLTPDIIGRVMTEDFARDSYENLIFSICRFHEITGNYPDRITVVGFDFKKARYIDLHLKAIRYPKIRFTYIGIDPPMSLIETKKGELNNGYRAFKANMYGCSEFLKSKKEARNPYKKHHGYNTSCPQLSELLDYCSPDGTKLFSGKLPWAI